MNQRYESSPREVSRMTTAELRAQFAVTDLFAAGEARFAYSHYDRMVLGGLSPGSEALGLGDHPELRAAHFLERREAGLINVGGAGVVEAAGERYEVDKLGAVYLGRGTEDVRVSSRDASDPAAFFLFSAPAHRDHPTRHFTAEQATPVTLGDAATSNRRTIYKYIHPEGIASCQVVMGLTVLAEGSVWNTMPPHTHDRRAEAYLYFDVPPGQGVMHFMGAPTETRHLWLRDREAAISPPWSIHAGAGTASYAFVWAMAGENQDFTDMDFLELGDLR